MRRQPGRQSIPLDSPDAHTQGNARLRWKPVDRILSK
jgi:hypothetical protein